MNQLSFTLTGKLISRGEVKQVSEKFCKLEFAIEATDGNPIYPQQIGLQLTQDRVSLLDGYKKDEEITVSVNLKGREWVSPQGERRFFNTLDVWKVERVFAPVPDPLPIPPVSAPAAYEPEDLPF